MQWLLQTFQSEDASTGEKTQTGGGRKSVSQFVEHFTGIYPVMSEHELIHTKRSEKKSPFELQGVGEEQREFTKMTPGIEGDVGNGCFKKKK